MMQSSNWAPEHSRALREYLTQRMSYADAANAINERFGTAYTRNAAIGRGKRMGLGSAEHPVDSFKLAPRESGPILKKIRKRRAAELKPLPAVSDSAEPVKLRCVGVSPRLISLIELEAGDCRYPYGGDKDDEAITFCGHPRLAGTSYCAAHFHLTRGESEPPERMPGPVVLRLVQAA
jgi:GcrA cell cycle regulator